MRFPRRVWRGFVLCALVLSFLDNAPIHASGQAATSNQGAPTRESKTGQSETRPLEFAEKSFPDAMIGVPFHGSVQAVGGWGFLALTVTGDVPPGLIVETGSNTVAVGGVPSATGEFQLQITAEDVNGNGITQDFTIHVFPLVPGSLATRPVVTDTENFTFTDADSVFFPIVLSDAENFTFTDAETENVLSPVIISDAENFTFSDKETDMNSVFIVDNENFTLT